MSNVTASIPPARPRPPWAQRGRILIETAATTRKARNVETRRHASVLVQTPDAAWDLGYHVTLRKTL